MKETVLCYIRYKNEILFLYRNKKKNDYNWGKYIGIGGHLEKGESVMDALRREIKEEIDYDINDYLAKYVGTVIFRNEYKDKIVKERMYVYVYDVNERINAICDEGTLIWVDKNNVNSLDVWEGDKCFLDKIINYNDNDEKIDLILNYKNDCFINCLKR